MHPFANPEKIRKHYGFLMFLGVRERGHLGTNELKVRIT